MAAKLPANLPFEDLMQIGDRLRRLVDAGQGSKGELPIRWMANEAFYDNAPPSSNPNDQGLVKVHVDFLSIRVKALTAMVCGVLGRQDPYMIAKDMQSGDRADRLEKTVHYFWQKARFEKALRDASTIAANTNKAIWKLSYREFDSNKPTRRAMAEMGIVFEVIHPKDWICIPALPDGIAEAKLCGNRIRWRRRRIIDAMKNGTFLDPDKYDFVATEVEGKDETKSILRSRANPNETGGEKDDDLIELWDLTVRLDLEGQNYDGTEKGSEPPKSGEKLYRVLLALDNQQILLIEPLEYSRPMYFESYYLSDEQNYWSGRSISHGLSGLQEVYNLYHSGIYTAIMTGAMPPIFADGLPVKYTRYKYGDVIPDAKNMTRPPWTPPSKFDGEQAAIYATQAYERIGDQSARISQNSMGSTSTTQTTATERNIVAAGVASGQEEYIANLSSGFGEMAESTCELLSMHWDDWYPRLGRQPVLQPDPATGQQVPVPDPNGDPQNPQPLMKGVLDVKQEDLDLPILWETTGKTPGNTPQAKMQAAQLLTNVAATIPAAGGDVYELFKVLVRESDLNAEGVQTNKEDMPYQQLMSQLQQAGIAPEIVMQALQQKAAMEQAMPPGGQMPQGQPNGG
jgi:hypothetical protein